jgi:hypothetical protein
VSSIPVTLGAGKIKAPKLLVTSVQALLQSLLIA